MNFNRQRTEFEPKEDFIRVAAASPEVSIGDVIANTNEQSRLYSKAAAEDVALVVFPEMSLTGYTIQDLVSHQEILDDCLAGLTYLAQQTTDKNTAAVIGLPVMVGNGLYNCAALIADGSIKGIVPKQNLPSYNEFYDKRWFQSWDDRDNTTVSIDGQQVPFGRKQLFNVAGSVVGIEICEDVWVPEQPSVELVKSGATVIVNPSASPEVVTKSQYRRQLIATTAARLVTGYVYASAASSESVSDIVMSGHAMINESGHMLAEQKPFATDPSDLVIADIDLRHIQFDRRKNSNFPVGTAITPTTTTINARQSNLLRSIDPLPFIPKGNPEEISERLGEIITIQSHGLAQKMRESGKERVVLGLSGGLDSTLALLVAMRASAILDKGASECIYTLTMPSRASSDRTQNNAANLANSLGIPNEEIAIAALTQQQLAMLHHSGVEDTTFENTQARIRQSFVFNKGNQIGAIALGTGDLSENALGWCTYNGDHMSGYNPNATIPKTLIRSLTHHASRSLNQQSRAIIDDILDTPISPELTGNGADITQKTEDIVGPYELHDFFLYHHLRWMEPKRKIGYLAMKAFEGIYNKNEVAQWLDVFMQRFYSNRWKQQAVPDGAKVGLSLNPKSDLRMAPATKAPNYSMQELMRSEMQTRLERSGILPS